MLLHTAKAKSAIVVFGLHLDQYDHKTSCVTSEWFTTSAKENFLGGNPAGVVADLDLA